MIYYYIIIT